MTFVDGITDTLPLVHDPDLSVGMTMTLHPPHGQTIPLALCVLRALTGMGAPIDGAPPARVDLCDDTFDEVMQLWDGRRGVRVLVVCPVPGISAPLKRVIAANPDMQVKVVDTLDKAASGDWRHLVCVEGGVDTSVRVNITV